MKTDLPSSSDKAEESCSSIFICISGISGSSTVSGSPASLSSAESISSSSETSPSPRSHLPIIGNRSPFLKGLVRKSSIPASVHFFFSPATAFAVTAIMGILTPFSLIFTAASNPFITGIWISIKIRSNLPGTAASEASKPLFATVTSILRLFKMVLKSF